MKLWLKLIFKQVLINTDVTLLQTWAVAVSKNTAGAVFSILYLLAIPILLKLVQYTSTAVINVGVAAFLTHSASLASSAICMLLLKMLHIV